MPQRGIVILLHSSAIATMPEEMCATGLSAKVAAKWKVLLLALHCLVLGIVWFCQAVALGQQSVFPDHAERHNLVRQYDTAYIFPRVLAGNFFGVNSGERTNPLSLADAGFLGGVRFGVMFSSQWSAVLDASYGNYNFLDSGDMRRGGSLGGIAVLGRYSIFPTMKGHSLYVFAGLALISEQRDMIAVLAIPPQRGFQYYSPVTRHLRVGVPLGVGGEVHLLFNVFAFGEFRYQVGISEASRSFTFGLMLRF
jgi:hypothetical protein